MSAPTATFEQHFTTFDKAVNDGVESDVVFNLIEDDCGNVWGYGHVDSVAFAAEIDRWRKHAGVYTTPQPASGVKHLWGVFRSADGESTEGTGEFVQVTAADAAWNDEAFPVTYVSS